MPVTVSIPVTQDYREVTLALGEADNLTSICLSPGYIFGVTDEAPAKLVRINRDNFNDRSVLTFADDDEHKNGADVMHVGATVGGGIYVMFRNGPPNTLMISKVDFTTTPMTYTDWWREEDYAASYGTMTTDDVYVYALIGPYPNAYIARMKLSDQTAVITQIPGVTFGRNLRISGSPLKLYAVGQTDPPDDGLMWVKRLRFDTDTLVVEQSTTISGGTTTVIPNNIGIELQPKDFIWVGSRDFTGTLKRIRKSNLSDVTTVSTAIAPSTSSGCRAMEDDNPFVWALFDNGKAVRINTDSTSLEQRTYALSGGFHYRMVSGDTYLFGSFYSAPTKIARYRIPDDPVSAQWPLKFGSTGYDDGRALAVAGTDLVVVGLFSGTVAFGSFTLTSATNKIDIFVTRLEQGTGAVTWVRAFKFVAAQVVGTNEYFAKEVKGVAVAPDGSIYVVGHFQGTVDFDGTTKVATSRYDIFVVKYSSTGVLQWVKTYGDTTAGNTNENACVGVDCDSAGNVYFTGRFSNKINFGPGDLEQGGNTVYVVRLDPADGSTDWQKQAGSFGTVTPGGIVLDSQDNIWVTGSFLSFIDFGAGAVNAVSEFQAVYLFKLSSANGSVLMNGATPIQRSFGNSFAANGNAVTVDSEDNVLVTGEVRGSVNFGGGATGSGFVHAFIAKYSPLNVHLRSRGIGYSGGGSSTGYSIAVDANDNPIVSGRFSFGVNFGDGTTNTHTSAGGTDIFIAKYLANTTNLAYAIAYGMGSTSQDFSFDVVVANGRIYSTGGFAGTVNFNGTDLTSEGSLDCFVVRI